MAINSNTNTIYLADSETRTLLTIDGSSKAINNTIQLPGQQGSYAQVHDIDVNPLNDTVYLSYEYYLPSGQYERKILVIDGSLDKIVDEMDNEVSSLEINPDDNRFYMIDTDGKFYRIRGTSVDSLDLGLTASNLYMTVDNIADTVYVGDRYGEDVLIINDGPRLENVKSISFTLYRPEFFTE